VPCLFVQGTRDPFGSPDELTGGDGDDPGPVTHEWIDGGRHDLKGADRRIGELGGRLALRPRTVLTGPVPDPRPRS
jgi:predicted alpha/beta-hydrolase family hydrolase